MAKKKLTEAEKKKRKEELAAESKHTKFKRVATLRLRKALAAIKTLARCSSKDYAYNKEQTDKIENELVNAVSKCVNSFSGTQTEESAIEL